MNTDFESVAITYNSLLYFDLILITEKCTISYIAESLNIAKSSVTLKVKELEKFGLVLKEQSVTDKRIFYLRLTEKAKQLSTKYNNGIIKAINEIEKKYSKEEIKTFIDILKVFHTQCSNECLLFHNTNVKNK